MVHFLQETVRETNSDVNDRLGQQFAYFFISRDAPPQDIIRSLVAQLAHDSSGVLVPSLRGLSPSTLSSLNLDWYQKELTKLTKSAKTILLLDGLDECSDTSELLSHLVELVKDSEITLKLLLTSNESAWEHALHATAKFPTRRCRFRTVDKALNYQAVKHYAYSEVTRRMRGAHSLGGSQSARVETLEMDLVKSLTDKAQGM